MCQTYSLCKVLLPFSSPPRMMWKSLGLREKYRTSSCLGSGCFSLWGLSWEGGIQTSRFPSKKRVIIKSLPRFKKWMEWLHIWMKEAVHWVELIRAEVSHGVLGCEYNYSPFRNEHVYTWPLFSTKAVQTFTSKLTQTTRGNPSIRQEPDIWSRSSRLDGSKRMRSWETPRSH